MRLFGCMRKGIPGIVVQAAFGLTLMGSVADRAEAQNQQYASQRRSAAAAGYYARARQMLVEALAEFEQGRKYARPDLVMDSEEWRLSLISLTEELNRLVDPKIRVTRDGVRFAANPRMVKRERERLPVVPDGPRDRNTYGEEQRMRELQASRAKLYDIAEDEKADPEQSAAEAPSAAEEGDDEASPDTQASRAPGQSVEQIIEEAVEEAKGPSSPGGEDEEEEETSQADEGSETEEEGLNEGAVEPQASSGRSTTAIEDAIRERIKTLESGEGAAAKAAPTEATSEREAAGGAAGSENADQEESEE